ncbi:unnamed protein product, partial [Urochloa humidicola]
GNDLDLRSGRYDVDRVFLDLGTVDPALALLPAVPT